MKREKGIIQEKIGFGFDEFGFEIWEGFYLNEVVVVVVVEMVGEMVAQIEHGLVMKLMLSHPLPLDALA
ncbi:hypothetical protein C5167_000083 [Papaver somniferum]|uniref:Uncharacterized protein n=1 Tax=Papaver somniferum TaxID=3469 RepID=A0A4Y7KVG3_PAPSO|nr:hypothetical protein C5167_000083 [Papaver somniferum]